MEHLAVVLQATYGVGNDTSKIKRMRYSSATADGGSGGKERSEFFIGTRTEDGGWGGIQSQDEMSAFFFKNRTDVQLFCSRSAEILQNKFSVCGTEFVLRTDFRI